MAVKSGQKAVVINDDAHKAAKIEAAKAGLTLGDWVSKLIFEAAKKAVKQ